MVYNINQHHPKVNTVQANMDIETTRGYCSHMSILSCMCKQMCIVLTYNNYTQTPAYGATIGGGGYRAGHRLHHMPALHQSLTMHIYGLGHIMRWLWSRQCGLHQHFYTSLPAPISHDMQCLSLSKDDWTLTSLLCLFPDFIVVGFKTIYSASSQHTQSTCTLVLAILWLSSRVSSAPLWGSGRKRVCLLLVEKPSV